MERLEDREKVLTTLEQYLKEDRAKTSVVNISPLGLVEITRKRVPTYLPVFTSITVNASAWSITIEPPERSHTFLSIYHH